MHPIFLATGLFDETPSQASVVWVLVCAALVLLMQAGFGLLESGLSRAKHSIHVAMKNLSDACVSIILFWLIGFGLMFGVSGVGTLGAGWFGTSHFAVGDGTALLVFFAFQVVFCGTATTIVSGATAERMRFSAYVVVSALVAAVVYPLFGHWAWGGAIPGTGVGWLAELGFIDFAGSTVVHGVGGWAALAVVIALGPRTGRFSDQSRSGGMHGHNYPAAAAGIMVVWFGWIGFNGGSTLAVNADVGRIIVNTILAGAVGGGTALAVGYAWERTARPIDLFGGIVAGLVAVTAGCHAFSVQASVLVAGGGGLVYLVASYWLERLRIDDVVGAVPAHAFAGAWGTIAVGFAADADRLAPGLSRWEQTGVQALGVVVAFVWSFAVVSAVAHVLRRADRLRVSEESEKDGLNVTEHGTSTATLDLLREMNLHREGHFELRASVEPHTEVGQIAERYNAVLDRVADETESRLKAAAALRHAEAEYRLMFENSLEGIYRRAADGSYTACNMSYALLLGFTCPDDLIESGPDAVAMRYESGEFPYEIDTVVTGKELRSTLIVGDEKREILERIRVLRNADGDVLWIQAAVADITETLRTQQLEHDVAVANTANAAKSEFLASMSHELRTPLHGVVGMLDIMGQTELSNQQSTLLANARLSADALLSQINDVLDLSKVEAGMLDIREAPFGLPKLVEDIVAAFRATVDQIPVELICDLGPNLTGTVVGDADRLRQILANLVGNAVKFTRAGEIRVSADRVSDEQVQFLVTDTGPGMDESVLETVFEPYTQGRSQTSHCKGTGLGLAIASKLAAAMNGEIAASSEVGVGTTFTLLLPLPAVEDMARDTSELSASPLRVLAVDHVTSNLEVIQRYLEDAGHVVTTSSDSDTVERLLEDADDTGSPIDVLIVDHQMPGRDGVEISASVHSCEAWSELPIIVASSATLGVADEEVEIAGIASVLEKPIRRSVLLDAVRLVGGRQTSAASDASEDGRASSIESGARVLVAEDNGVNQCFVRHVLESIGCEAMIVDDGEPAVAAYRAAIATGQPFDIVFMDCQMLDVDGFEATRRIRDWETQNQAPITPIVALTANAIVGDRERCLEAGMSDYLTKPISSEAIRGVIVNTLNDRQTLNGCQEGSEAAVGLEASAIEAETSIASDEAVVASGQPVEKQADTSWIDLADLRERCLDDDEFLRAVLTQFSEELPHEFEQLRAAFDAGDWSGLARSAHALSGFAGNVAAKSLSEQASTLEKLALSDTGEERSSCEEVVLLLGEAVDQTHGAAVELLARHAGSPRNPAESGS